MLRAKRTVLHPKGIVSTSAHKLAYMYYMHARRRCQGRKTLFQWRLTNKNKNQLMGGGKKKKKIIASRRVCVCVCR